MTTPGSLAAFAMDRGKGGTKSSISHNNLPRKSSPLHSLPLPAWTQCPNLPDAKACKVPPLYLEVLSKTQSQVNPSLCETAKLYPILLSSGLQTELLAAIWTFVNRSIPGQLTLEELFLALALVALAQQRKCPFAFNEVFSLSQPPVPRLSLLPQATFNENNNHLISIKEKSAKKIETDDDEFTDFTSCSISNASKTNETYPSRKDQEHSEYLTDKYQAFRELEVTSSSSNEVQVRKLCLTACKNLLQKSFNTLIVNHGEDCALEALRHPLGRQFIQDLTLVHSISLRASSDCDADDLQVAAMGDDISRLWSSLTTLFKRAHPSLACASGVSPNGGQLTCRICQWKDCNVTQVKGKSYHQECANLWLNCVSSNLPV